MAIFSVFRRKAKQEAVQLPAQQASTVHQPVSSTFVASYPVLDPFVHIAIARRPETDELTYIVIEPELTEKEHQFLESLEELLRITLQPDAQTLLSKKGLDGYLRNQAQKTVGKLGLRVRKQTFDKLMYYLARDLLRYGRVDPMMKDPMIEDISCDAPGVPVYVWHREYESLVTNVSFATQDELDRFVLKLAYKSGRHASVFEPLIDAALPDGSRVQLSYGTEVTKKGSNFTIRKFKEDPYSIVDIIRANTLNSEMAALIWFALENKSSILMSGGTASGKTTTINCVAGFISPEVKIVTIEDTPEINLPHVNWIQSVSRIGFAGAGEITLFDLVKAAMRQRPDFIIVGEVRGAEASTLFQAISTGHAGLSSIHGESVAASIRRLNTEPMSIPRPLLASVNFIIQQARVSIGGRPARRVVSITEIVGLDPRTDEFITNEVYRYEPSRDSFVYGGRSYLAERIGKAKGMSQEGIVGELRDRKMVIDWMVKRNIRNYKEVSSIVGNYYTDKESLLKRAVLEIV